MPTDDAPVLVTGGAGFLGSHLVTALAKRGHRVIALDVDHDQGRLDDDLGGVERVTGDILDERLVDELVARSSRVLHFAAIAGVHAYLERPLEVLDVNLLGTRTVLTAAARHDRAVVMASSSEAYGKNPSLLREDGDTWLGPTTHARWCYATSKVAGEHYAWALAQRGLTVAAVRYFNVYGPTLDAPGRGRVLSQFLGQLQAGQPLMLVDGGRAVRCFCYIDDAVAATVELALALAPGPLAGRPFNIGHPEPVTMRELAEKVLRLTGSSVGTADVAGEAFFGAGFEDIPHRVPDVTAMHELLGVHAKVSLDEGLTRVLAHWDMLAETPVEATPRPIPVIRPCYDADEALLGRYRRALQAGHTTNDGPEVRGLEHEAADWLGTDRVCAVGSGADGLLLAMLALDRRGTVVLPSFTYVASCNAVELAGCQPVFCDVDSDTWTMDPGHLATLLAAHDDVVAVMPVCAFGVPPELDAIAAVAGDIPLIYDAAHALGTTVAGARYDSRPFATVYSLHATKVLPAIEGGLVAGDPALLDEVRDRRRHGLGDDPLAAVLGHNGKLDELSAATARHSLARIDDVLARRRTSWLRLTLALAEDFHTQEVPDGVVVNGQNLVAGVPGSREHAAAVFAAHGVGTRRYFHPPLHLLHRHAPAPSLPVTEAMWARNLCLPLHSRMSEAVLQRIERAIEAVAL